MKKALFAASVSILFASAVLHGCSGGGGGGLLPAKTKVSRAYVVNVNPGTIAAFTIDPARRVRSAARISDANAAKRHIIATQTANAPTGKDIALHVYKDKMLDDKQAKCKKKQYSE